MANTQDEVLSLDKNAGKIIAFNTDLAQESAMQYEIDRKEHISLADYTRKGIELLDIAKKMMNIKGLEFQ